LAAVRAEALHGLAEIQAPADQTLPAALAALDDADPLVRNAARYLLGRLGEAAHGAVPQLRETLRHGNEQERILSAWALVQIAPSPEVTQAAIPLMIRALQRPNPRARIEAARVLTRIGEGVPDVIAALQTATSDEDPGVRAAAGEALKVLQTS